MYLVPHRLRRHRAYTYHLLAVALQIGIEYWMWAQGMACSCPGWPTSDMSVTPWTSKTSGSASRYLRHEKNSFPAV